MRKKQPKNGNSAAENGTLSIEDREELERGVHYFNEKNFERAHEAWELLSERKSEIDKKYLKGMMQLALSANSVMRNGYMKSDAVIFQRVYDDLKCFPPDYFGMELNSILQFLEQITTLSTNREKIGKEVRIPHIRFHKPLSPDVCAAVSDAVRSDQFCEGVALFNKGLFWEAHEVWQELWRDQTIEGKDFVDTFMKMSEAYSFARRGKLSSAIYLFEKALKQFSEYESHSCEISPVQLVEEITRDINLVRSAIAENTPQVKFQQRPVIEYTSRG
jgi:predicted metal-dependent hydrolase